MRISHVGVVRSLVVGIVLLGGCSNEQSSEDAALDAMSTVHAPERAGQTGDICAPNMEPDADDAPEAPCASRFEYHVPDLGDESSSAESGGQLSTQTLAPLDNGGATRASCNGKTGAGFTTCGNGSDNCCRSKTVPAGTAGDIRVDTSFDLGVYEVTSGRFAAFVTELNGDVRGAATSGRLPGFNVEWASHLPSSRAAVDEELGPACKYRSDVADYGARTWPSPDVERTVASFIKDKNQRAADIREDATPTRLYAKPINCVSYWMAAAFCAWDGGRLPTNAEWTYTALGGNQLREYPWGSGRTADKLVTDLKRDANSFTFPEDFPWFDNGFNAYHIAPPGRKPAGASRWGHQDMGGNLLEWVADITKKGAGIVRGGSWEGHKDLNAQAYVNYPLDRTYGSLGFRCAYGDVQPPPPPQPPAPEGETQPVHRSYNAAIGDHLQGLIQNEGAPGWGYERVSFKTWKTRPANGRALFRCRRNGTSNHFLSNSPSCEGHTSEGSVGFVSSVEAAGTRPIYRCVKGNDRLSTLTPAECRRASFVVEGKQGYALP